VCSSEAVLLGHPNGERVLLNRDETFLFTDYVIAVEKWIRPARRLESILESITLSAIGGEVELPGRTLRAIAVPRLMPRHPYILFMRRLEGTNGFAYQSAPRPVNLHSFTVSPEESSKGPIV
jgi:hypothetical protein